MMSRASKVITGIDSNTIDRVFELSEKLAGIYEYPHYIYRAIDSEGISNIGSRRELFSIIKCKIDNYDPQHIKYSSNEQLSRLDSVANKDVAIDCARRRMLEYPDIDEFKRDWDEQPCES